MPLYGFAKKMQTDNVAVMFGATHFSPFRFVKKTRFFPFYVVAFFFCGKRSRSMLITVTQEKIDNNFNCPNWYS